MENTSKTLRLQLSLEHNQTFEVEAEKRCDKLYVQIPNDGERQSRFRKASVVQDLMTYAEKEKLSHLVYVVFEDNKDRERLLKDLDMCGFKRDESCREPGVIYMSQSTKSADLE